MKAMHTLMLACMMVAATAVSTQAVIVEFNGAIDLTYSDWAKDGQSAGISTFDVYEAYLLGRADISENVSGYFELRAEHSEEALSLRQGYLKWRLREPVQLTMGYFYAPIGQYWTTYYASTRKFASYAYAMRLINVTPWGEAGAMLGGTVPVASTKVSYALAIINGLGANYIDSSKPRDGRQTRDNNNNKMIAGRLGFSPIEELEIGVSYANGKYDPGSDLTLSVIDADFSLTVADLSLRGEYVQSAADTAETGDPIESSGFYVHAGYKVIKDRFGINYIEPVVRYEQVDPGKNMKDVFSIGPTSTGAITGITAGLNVSPCEHFLLKAEYRWTTEELDPQLENDAIFFQACIDF